MGKGSFVPPGMIQTAAQNAAAGRRMGMRRRRAPRRAARARAAPRKRRGKPRPGTKAWMAYIRSKRKK